MQVLGLKKCLDFHISIVTLCHTNGLLVLVKKHLYSLQMPCCSFTTQMQQGVKKDPNLVIQLRATFLKV